MLLYIINKNFSITDMSAIQHLFGSFHNTAHRSLTADFYRRIHVIAVNGIRSCSKTGKFICLIGTKTDGTRLPVFIIFSGTETKNYSPIIAQAPPAICTAIEPAGYDCIRP